MRISIFGTGYVGAVSAGGLAERGHEVVGVDVSRLEIDLTNSGKSPIVEPRLAELLCKGITSRRIRGTSASICADLLAVVIRKSIEVAEMVKYTCNIRHAVKITFAVVPASVYL